MDFCLHSPELSRSFRGEVWLPFKMHGAGAFHAQFQKRLALARLVVERIRGMAGMEILAEPNSPRSPSASSRWASTLPRNSTVRLMERVNARQRVFLTGTMLGDRFALRICVLSFRTHRDRIEAGLEDLEAARREVLVG